MGKGARIRRRRAAQAAAAEPTAAAATSSTAAPSNTPVTSERPGGARSGLLFHGGVPGLQVGGLVVSAARLGVRYRYAEQVTDYDPGWVYATTDLGVAQAYASRYLSPAGRTIPGDVYEVDPGGEAEVDPDYAMFPLVFVRARQARIIAVAERGVALSVAEQGRRERRFLVWEHPDQPIWDVDGLLQPSPQMLSYGVTSRWTSLLRPWLNTTEIDGRGRLVKAARSSNFWVAALELVPSLDGEHEIEQVGHRGEVPVEEVQVEVQVDGRARDAVYRCRSCGGRRSIEEISGGYALTSNDGRW